MPKKLLLLLVSMAFFMTIIGAASAAEYDTTLTLTTNDADNTINTGDSVTLEAYLQVEGSGGLLSDVQNAPIEFRVDGTTIATVNTGVNGRASYIYTPTTPGQKIINAAYAGSSVPHQNPDISNTIGLTVCAYNPNQGVNPVANDDAVTNAVEDTPFAAGVAGNDVFGSGTNTWAVTTPALHGNVVMNPLDGTYTYTPTGTNYFGIDTFIYTLSAYDGEVTRTDTALVTITIANVNDAPVAADDSANTNEDTPVTINVLANDSDPDGNALTVTGVTQPANGSVVINGGTTVTYTPNSNWNGVDTFTYTISDGNGGTDTATVTVTVAAVADADLVLTKTVNNAAPVVKDTVIFTLIVNNNGPDTAVGVTVNDKLPAGLTYVSSVANFGTYDPVTGLWSIASLPNGASAVLTITAVVDESGQIINQANVSAITWDPNLEGNAASASINAQAAETEEVNAQTVAMQKTGAPIFGLLLAFFMVLTGMVLPRRK